MHTCLHWTHEPALTYIHAQLYAWADARFLTLEQRAEPSMVVCQDKKWPVVEFFLRNPSDPGMSVAGKGLAGAQQGWSDEFS